MGILDAPGVGRGALTKSVKEYGALGDNSHDDAAAIQAASTAAGIGGTVFFPPGKYIWGATSGITLPISQRWIGASKTTQVGGGGQTYIKFPNLTSGHTGVIGSTDAHFENLFFYGPGASHAGLIGLSNAGTAYAPVQASHCQFYGWETATQLVASYYSSFDHCEWRHNEVGLDLTSVCYNVNLLSPRFDGSGAANGLGTGIRADSVESLNIFGGSIESYGGRFDAAPHAGIQVTGTATRSNINLFGIYMESATDTDGATGIDIHSTTKVNLKVFGGEIMLSGHDSWIDFRLATSGQVFTRGITFFGSSSVTTSPTAYMSNLATIPSTESVDFSGDVWDVSGIAGASYDGGLSTLRKQNVCGSPPETYGLSGATAKKSLNMGRSVVVPFGSWITSGSGITSARPSLSYATAGALWFDTTLGKPVWVNTAGTGWVDATGAAV